MTDRYDSSESAEGQYQPGSGGLVLVNRLGITDLQEINDLELALLEQLYDVVMSEVETDQVITVADVFEWHRKWLGNVYDWAGKERSVNISKEDFHFAATGQIPDLLKKFDKNYLSQHTPCNRMNDGQLIEAIAIVQAEFILVHPFREGNGRIARLLSNVMALQANKPELDFSSWDRNRDDYFLAIQAAMDCNYEPMKGFVKQALLHGGQGVLST